MANVASPYGLKPINLIGGQPFAGSFREYKMAADSAYGIYNGDLIVLSSAGVPQSLAVANASPVAPIVSGSPAAGTAGIVGVCVGVRYVNPATKQPLYGQYLPATAVTLGYTDIFVRVADDPDQLFQIQGDSALGTFNSGTGGSGWPGALGKNAALSTFRSGSNTTGNSGMKLLVNTNGSSLATTASLAIRIVDMVEGTEGDSYPEFVVKLNAGLHSYYNSLGV